MLSKFLSDKVHIAKAWSGAVRDVCDSYLFASDTLSYMVMVEVGPFNNAIIKDEFIAEIYAKDIAVMIHQKGWGDLSVEEVAVLVQQAFDFEHEEVKERLDHSEVTFIQKKQGAETFKKESVKVPELV